MSAPTLGYSLRFRLTPESGVASDLDFGGLLAGSLQWSHAPERVSVTYDLVRQERETVNYRKAPLYLGWRRRVAVAIIVSGDTAEVQNDHGMIAALVNGCVDPAVVVEASLDGGSSYFAVVLARYRGPDPLGGKISAGARYVMEFDAVDLISELPTLTDVTVDSVPAGW